MVRQTRPKLGRPKGKSKPKTINRSTQTESPVLQVIVEKLAEKHQDPVEIVSPRNYNEFANSIRSHATANSSDIIDVVNVKSPNRRKRLLKAGPKCYKEKIRRILEQEEDVVMPIMLDEEHGNQLSVIVEQPSAENLNTPENVTPEINVEQLNIQTTAVREITVHEDTMNLSHRPQDERNNISPPRPSETTHDSERNNKRFSRTAFFRIRADNVTIYNYFTNSN